MQLRQTKEYIGEKRKRNGLKYESEMIVVHKRIGPKLSLHRYPVHSMDRNKCERPQAGVRSYAIRGPEPGGQASAHVRKWSLKGEYMQPFAGADEIAICDLTEPLNVWYGRVSPAVKSIECIGTGGSAVLWIGATGRC